MSLRRGQRRMATNMSEEYAEESPETTHEKAGKFRTENTQNADDTNNKSDKDILLLLEKINLQLENLRLSEDNQQDSKEANTGVEELVTQLLKNNKTNQDKQNKTSDTKTLLAELLNQSGSKQKAASQQPQQNKSANDTLVLQTAAEVLSRAQYELSNELENSLKKLKQVISESEQIASKISNLIEQKQQ